MSVSAQPRMAEDKPCRGRNSAAEASDGHGRQEQERVTDAARREDRSGARLVSEPTGPGEGQRQMAQPPLFSSRQPLSPCPAFLGNQCNDLYSNTVS